MSSRQRKDYIQEHGFERAWYLQEHSEIQCDQNIGCAMIEGRGVDWNTGRNMKLWLEEQVIATLGWILDGF